MFNFGKRKDEVLEDTPAKVMHFHRRICILANKLRVLLELLGNAKEHCKFYRKEKDCIALIDFNYRDIYIRSCVISTVDGQWSLFEPSESLSFNVNPKKQSIEMHSDFKTELIKPMLNSLENKICRAIQELENLSEVC